MKRYVIDAANGAKAYGSIDEARKCSDGEGFATEKEFLSVAAEWPM